MPDQSRKGVSSVHLDRARTMSRQETISSKFSQYTFGE
ncbi:hypothetical protein SynM161_01065 [Synechococcus sp. M16.1]|nr:hypothetical protein SynM161_01065 [Synechococcus sp. M16.1]